MSDIPQKKLKLRKFGPYGGGGHWGTPLNPPLEHTLKTLFHPKILKNCENGGGEGGHLC